jgi:hypothetical protein
VAVFLMPSFDPRVQSQRAEEINGEITNERQGDGANDDQKYHGS